MKASRPRVVLFDVFETVLQLDALRARFADVGRPAHELELFFARLLRDGMALTLAGGRVPAFRDVAAAVLRTTSGHQLDDRAIDHVLVGFAQLPAHPDVKPAFAALNRVGVPAYALTHGSATVAETALDGAGLRYHLAGVLSSESIGSFKPPPNVYHWACERVGSPPGATAMVAAHSWDTHGAGRAGLLTGYVTRLEGQLPVVFDKPTVSADRLDGVVEGLLALG